MAPADAPFFPCPVCLQPLDVRMTKRNRPYVICSPCGVQMFVREKAGIVAFERLVKQAARDDLWTRLAELEKRYRLRCPECGKSFWIRHELIATSWFDGEVVGYRCPQKDCEGIAKWEASES